MWQRIQTLWWIVSIAVVVFFGFEEILLYKQEASSGVIYFLQRSTGVYGVNPSSGASVPLEVYGNWSVAILCGVSVLLSLVSIFIYRMRSFQLRLSILNALVLIGVLLCVAYTGYRFVSISGAEFAGIRLWLSLPLIAIIMQVLAALAVLKDETLVRMSNRLR